MNSTPKAYLITAAESLEDCIEERDKPHVYKISKMAYLIDAKDGFYLVSDLSKDVENDFCAVPIFENVIGCFSGDAEHWLNSRGIGIQRSRA